MELASIGQPEVVAATLIGCGVLFLLWFAATRSAGTTSTGSTLFLDVLSLPVGAFAVAAAAASGWYGTVSAYFLLVLGISGAMLLGRSLRDLPWVGLLSLALAGVTAYFVYGALPAFLPWWVAVIAAVIVLVLAYIVLGVVGGLFKLVSLVAVPRVVSLVIAFVALGTGVWVGVTLLGWTVA